MIKEHDCIVLTTDLPAEGLRAGDVGTVIHIHGENWKFSASGGSAGRINSGGGCLKVRVGETRSLLKGGFLCMIGWRHVFEMQSASEGREGTPLLKHHGKPAVCRRESGAAPGAVFGGRFMMPKDGNPGLMDAY